MQYLELPNTSPVNGNNEHTKARAIDDNDIAAMLESAVNQERMP